MRRVTAVALALVATLAAGACSLGDRTEHARQLVASPRRAEAAGTAVGTMTFQLTAKPVGEGREGALAGGAGLANISQPPAGEVPIIVDFANRTASISLAAPGGAPEPVVVLAGDQIYVRRGTTTGISSRRWVVLDLAAIDEFNPPEPNEVTQRTGLPIVAFPGPLHLIEL